MYKFCSAKPIVEAKAAIVPIMLKFSSEMVAIAKNNSLELLGAGKRTYSDYNGDDGEVDLDGLFLLPDYSSQEQDKDWHRCFDRVSERDWYF